MKTAPPTQAPTIQQFSAYNEAFDFFNKRLFGSKLGPALLTIARKGRSTGHFTPRKWANKAGESVHEIAISPDVLTLGVEATMTTLLALMARQLRWQEAAAAGDEKAAATVARGYHDARLVEILLELGLRPRGRDGKSARGGWHLASVVVPDTPADDAMDALPNKARLPWEAVVEEPKDEADAGKKTGRVKYTCRTCESHVLGRPGLSVYCTGGVEEHPRQRMVGEDEPPNDAEEVGAAPVEEESTDGREKWEEPEKRPTGVDEPERRTKPVVRPEPEPVAEEPAVETIHAERRGRSATAHLEHLDRWAETVNRDAALTWNDLGLIEARWAAAQQVIGRHRRRWVGKELEVSVGYSTCEYVGKPVGAARGKPVTVIEGTRVQLENVRPNRIVCRIIGGKNDGLRVSLPALNLREVPPSGVPAPKDDEEVEVEEVEDEEEEEPAKVPPEWYADWRERPPAGWAWLLSNGSPEATYHLRGDYSSPACGARLGETHSILGTWEEITCRKCKKLHAPRMDDKSLGGRCRLWKEDRNFPEVHADAGCRPMLHRSPLRWIGEASEVTCVRCRRERDEIPARSHEKRESDKAEANEESET
jgi:hypothetical protein